MHCGNSFGQAGKDLVAMLDGESTGAGELSRVGVAPRANDVFSDFEVALKRQVRTEDESLVETVLAEQRPGRAGRNGEGFVVPVERMDPRDRSEDRLGSGGQPQAAPADIRPRARLDLRAEGACQHLTTEAMAEDRNLAGDGVAGETKLGLHPRVGIIHAVVAAKEDDAAERPRGPRHIIAIRRGERFATGFRPHRGTARGSPAAARGRAEKWRRASYGSRVVETRESRSARIKTA